jgi:hypothetical protein
MSETARDARTLQRCKILAQRFCAEDERIILNVQGKEEGQEAQKLNLWYPCDGGDNEPYMWLTQMVQMHSHWHIVYLYGSKKIVKLEPEKHDNVCVIQ